MVRVAGVDGARYALPSTATIVFTFGEDRFKSLGMFLSKIIKNNLSISTKVVGAGSRT